MVISRSRLHPRPRGSAGSKRRGGCLTTAWQRGYREDGRPVIDCRETGNPDKTRCQEGNLPSGTWADERTPDQPGRAPLLEFLRRAWGVLLDHEESLR